MIKSITNFIEEDFLLELIGKGLNGTHDKENNFTILKVWPLLLSRNIEWVDYPYKFTGVILKKLESLKELWAIISFEKINSEYKMESLWDEEEFLSTTNFEAICDATCWTYKIFCSIEKLNSLYNVLFQPSKLALIIRKKLINNISNSILKEQSKNPFHHNIVFDIESIIDEIENWEENLMFNDAEILLYSLASHTNYLHISQYLNYLMNSLEPNDSEKLRKIINTEKNIHYYDDEIELKDGFGIIWNIQYLKSDVVLVKNSDISYNSDTGKLLYKNKICNFSLAKQQSEFITKLANNLNVWICEDDLDISNHYQTYRDICKKLKTNPNGEFSDYEIKALLQNFQVDNKRYYIMISSKL